MSRLLVVFAEINWGSTREILIGNLRDGGCSLCILTRMRKNSLT